MALDFCVFSLILSPPSPDDDLRQTDGFKNVSLGNVLAVAYATQREKLTFLEEEDKVGTGSPRLRTGLACRRTHEDGEPSAWRGKSTAAILALPLPGLVALTLGPLAHLSDHGGSPFLWVVARMRWAERGPHGSWQEGGHRPSVWQRRHQQAVWLWWAG